VAQGDEPVAGSGFAGGAARGGLAESHARVVERGALQRRRAVGGSAPGAEAGAAALGL
jgi:hypothetical protein